MIIYDIHRRCLALYRAGRTCLFFDARATFPASASFNMHSGVMTGTRVAQQHTSPARPAEQEMIRAYLGASMGSGIEVDKVMEENQFLKNRLRLVLAAVQESPENSPRSSSPLPALLQDAVSRNGCVDLHKVMEENKLLKDKIQLLLIEEQWLKEKRDSASEEQQRARLLAFEQEERVRQAYAEHSIAEHVPYYGDASATRSPFPDGNKVGDGVYYIACATSSAPASLPQWNELSHNTVQVFLVAVLVTALKLVRVILSSKPLVFFGM